MFVLFLLKVAREGNRSISDKTAETKVGETMEGKLGDATENANKIVENQVAETTQNKVGERG